MKLVNLSLLFSCLLFVSSRVSAQNDPVRDSDSNPARDPFARTEPKQGSDSDPFAGNSKPIPTVIDAGKASDRIRKVLGHSTSQHFDETPLVEAIHKLSVAHDIPIVVDGRAIEEIGLSDEEPIVIDLHHVSLRSFLRLMLHDLNLTYTVHDSVLVITTQEASETYLDLRAYRLNSSLAGHSKEVIAAIRKTIEPRAWDEVGGYASIEPVIEDVIVVSTTETMHEQIQDFLDKVEAAIEQ